MRHLRLANKLFNQVLLIEESYLATFVAAFFAQDEKSQLGVINLGDGTSLTPSEAMQGAVVRRNSGEPLYALHGSTAVIQVSGTLVNKGSYVESMSNFQGYNAIGDQFLSAMDDNRVERIIFDIDSPGGEVAGCFDLCDLIYGFRDEKPTIAFVGEYATSAAYALASSCGTVYTPRTGIAGSIGVVIAHRDMSKKMEKEGIDVTLIHSGKHKVDGNPFEALSDDVRDSLQERVDDIRNTFAETVARNRGLPVEAVLSTEAQIYSGQSAVDVGLADGVKSLQEVMETMDPKETQPGSGPVLEKGGAQPQAGSEPSSTTEPGIKAASAEQIVELCEKAGANVLVSGFIKEKASVEKIESDLKEFSGLKDSLTAAEFTPEAVDRIVANFGDSAAIATAIVAEKAEDPQIRGGIDPKEEASDDDEGHDFYGYRNKDKGE